MDWFGSIGAAVTDYGNPFAGSASVHGDGSMSAATLGLTGYSIVEASSLPEAAKLVAGCPVLAVGGSLELYEAAPM